MKIKGIDLYKRVLGEDETILGKVFEFNDMKIKVANTFGSLSNAWGLAKDGGCEFHIFYKSSRKEIDEIFKAEWTKVRQAVEPYIAIKEFIENRTPFTIEMPSGNVYTQTNYYKLGILRRDGELERGIDGQLYKVGKWYIED